MNSYDNTNSIKNQGLQIMITFFFFLLKKSNTYSIVVLEQEIYHSSFLRANLCIGTMIFKVVILIFC